MSEESSPSRAAPAPSGSLPPPPPGYGYIHDPVHGFTLVLLTDGSAPRRAPIGGQPASRGLPAPAHHDNVRDIRTGTSQLVPRLIGGQDPYADLLAKVPDIAPGGVGSHFLPGLVPADEEVAQVAEAQRAVVRPLNATVPDDGDLGDGAGRMSHRLKDLAGAGGSSGGEAA